MNPLPNASIILLFKHAISKDTTYIILVSQIQQLWLAFLFLDMPTIQSLIPHYNSSRFLIFAFFILSFTVTSMPATKSSCISLRECV